MKKQRKMGYGGEVIIERYDMENDRASVEDLERRCEVGPAERFILFTDTLGDPICRIRNSPSYNMLVAKLGDELVGVIRGSIKLATVNHHNKPNLAKVGYILGLRVSPHHRRKGIGQKLVLKLEEWFIQNDVEFAHMATEKDNRASVKLFMDKLGYVKFRTPTILVNPVSNRSLRISKTIQITKIKPQEAELLYNKFMASSTELFPDDIGNILNNKLSLGTWVAYYPSNEKLRRFGIEGKFPTNWAMLSVWNSGEIFKLRLEKAPMHCLVYTKSSRLINKLFPCLNFQAIPDFFKPFGFYFIYGLHHQGAESGKLVRGLCKFVHNMGTREKSKDCKVIVTEVDDGNDVVKVDHIPHWKSLSCPEDLWCIKSLKNEEDKERVNELTTKIIKTSLFVDPREV